MAEDEDARTVPTPGRRHADVVPEPLSTGNPFDARAEGTWGCLPELYPSALALILAGRVQVAPFVEQHPLDDINRIFDAVHRREIRRRAVLVPN